MHHDSKKQAILTKWTFDDYPLVIILINPQEPMNFHFHEFVEQVLNSRPENSYFKRIWVDNDQITLIANIKATEDRIARIKR